MKLMRYELIHYPHKTLLKKSNAIKNFDTSLHALLADMKKVMNKKQGVGIAAPQVNVLLRCFHVRNEKEILTFVNPIIKKVSSHTNVYEEGCLSIPGVYAEVSRPQALSIEAYNEQGVAFSIDVDGYLARVIQHEFDHLEGILFIDRISSSARRTLLKAYTENAL